MKDTSVILACSKCDVKNGRVVDKLIGALPKEQLEKEIARIV